jgi:hypothetical protein
MRGLCILKRGNKYVLRRNWFFYTYYFGEGTDYWGITSHYAKEYTSYDDAIRAVTHVQQREGITDTKVWP